MREWQLAEGVSSVLRLVYPCNGALWAIIPRFIPRYRLDGVALGEGQIPLPTGGDGANIHTCTTPCRWLRFFRAPRLH